VRRAFDALRLGGTLVCIGLPAEGAEFVLPGPELVRQEKIVTGTLYGSCNPHTDMPLVLDLFMAGRLELDRLVTRTYGLEEINRAFADMTAGLVARGVIELARSLTDGRGADYAFVAAGVPVLVRQAFDALRLGGTLVCIGLPAEGSEVVLPGPELVRQEKIVTGTLYGSCRPHTDMPLVLDLYMAGRLDLDRLVTKTYGLEEINGAFADMTAGSVARGVIDLT